MKPTFKTLISSMALFAIVLTANAQKNFALDTTKSTFSVSGTSTMHDWTMKSASGTGTANLTLTDSKLTAITSLTINLPAESIKSEKSSMDKVAYKSLKTDKFKSVKYVLKSATKVNETTWNLVGTYTIAGVAKEVKTDVKATIANGVISLDGSNKITFTQFGMKSPTAMLGTIKTGEDLTVKFSIKLK
ncbi:YceI family protein [Flavobacterium sp. WC2509]|uniref:YceI family protein n=1 Tax=Flavobacterium sp. WC2509 TaxID=3461406 RepID=UPI004043D426